METDQRHQEYVDDTISLIDLLAVLIKHRLLIVLGTVAALVGAILYVSFVRPEPEPPADIAVPAETASYTAQLDVLAMPLQPSAAIPVSVDPPLLLAHYLESPPVVAYALAQSLPDTTESAALNAEVARTLLSSDETFSIVVNPEPPGDTGRVFAIKFSDGDQAVSETFVRALFSRAQDQAATQIQTAITAQQPAATDRSDIALAPVSDPGSYFAELGFHLQETRVAPAPPPEQTSGQMIVVIATITAFFLLVFLAFVLEYVGRVKRDPEEISKLKEAWRGKASGG